MSLKVGVRAHDLADKQSIEELTKAVKGFGLENIQLVFPKALKDYSYDDLFVNHVSDVLSKEKIHVTMLGAYFNPVHSHRDVVEKGIENFKANLRISHRFEGKPPVGSETGSYNDSPWIYVPRNQTEEGYQETKKVFMDLKDYAQSIDSDLIIESAWGHVIYSYQQHARLLQELNSDHVYATIDLYNLLYEGNFDQRDEIFEGALRTLGNKIRVLHIKDADVIDGKLVQLAPGDGKFHYGFMIDCAKKYCPDATLVFEGVKKDKISQAIEVIDKVL
jgi:L-ribulose-5-phosphate 3-epimerase